MILYCKLGNLAKDKAKTTAKWLQKALFIYVLMLIFEYRYGL